MTITNYLIIFTDLHDPLLRYLNTVAALNKAFI